MDPCFLPLTWLESHRNYNHDLSGHEMHPSGVREHRSEVGQQPAGVGAGIGGCKQGLCILSLAFTPKTEILN